LNARIPPVKASLKGAHPQEAGSSRKPWMRGFEVLTNIQQVQWAEHQLETVREGQVGQPGVTDFGPGEERSSGPCAEGK